MTQATTFTAALNSSIFSKPRIAILEYSSP
jgi:hypothetical protein